MHQKSFKYLVIINFYKNPILYKNYFKRNMMDSLAEKIG